MTASARLLAPILSLFLAAALAAADTATAWVRWEQTLTSERDHANPYRDVTLRATFTGSDGRSFSGDGFWDGGRTFRIRAAFSAPGEWTWMARLRVRPAGRTPCS